jgi:hypothetical protein
VKYFIALLTLLAAPLAAQVPDSVKVDSTAVVHYDVATRSYFTRVDTLVTPPDTVVVTDTIVTPPDTVVVTDTLTLPPDTVVVTDTLVTPPDTVVVEVPAPLASGVDTVVAGDTTRYVFWHEAIQRITDSTKVVVATPPPAISGGCPSNGYLRLVNVSTKAQLDAAFSAALAGDQIRLAAGTYVGSTNLSRSGTSANRITVCGMPGVWPVMTGDRFKLSGSFVTVTGIDFKGPNNDVNVWLYQGHDVLFTGNIVRESDGHAGLSVDYTYNTQITYNRFLNNGGPGGEIDHGIYYRSQATTATTRNLIANNIIVGTVGRGISMHDNGGEPINYTTVVHNTIVRSGSSGILLALEAGHDNIVANNLLADNGHTYDMQQIRWKHGEAQILNNILWSPVASRRGTSALGGGTVASGNLLVDPLVVAQWGDLHLQAGSPAIGLGLPQHVVSPDFDGKARDSAPDAGAYER